MPTAATRTPRRKSKGKSKARRAPAKRPAPAAQAPAGAVRVLPVGPENWSDFAALFRSRGAPHYCWCSVYRFRDAHELSKPQKQRAMRRLVEGGTPIGVLAYAGDVAVGWCSVAPRESYVKLERSRTMPRVSDDPTWTVLCFFVQRSHRGSGVAHALLAGAIELAHQRGARVVEGYPHDTAGISATHRGTARLFRALGFERQGTRWCYGLGPAPG